MPPPTGQSKRRFKELLCLHYFVRLNIFHFIFLNEHHLLVTQCLRYDWWPGLVYGDLKKTKTCLPVKYRKPQCWMPSYLYSPSVWSKRPGNTDSSHCPRASSFWTNPHVWMCGGLQRIKRRKGKGEERAACRGGGGRVRGLEGIHIITPHLLQQPWVVA